MKKVMIMVIVGILTILVTVPAMAQNYVEVNTGNITANGIITDLPTMGFSVGCRKENVGIEVSVNETGYISDALIKLNEIDVKVIGYHDFNKMITGFIGVGVGAGSLTIGNSRNREINGVGTVGVQINITEKVSLTMKSMGTSSNLGTVSLGLTVKL